MRKNLLEFLFGPAAVRQTNEALGESIVKLFEDAAEEEMEQTAASKKPLVAALKSIGIDKEVGDADECYEIHCDCDAEYHELVAKLRTPEAMHKLAEQGWIMSQRGDQAMSNEVPDLKIGFIELGILDTPDNKKDAESLEKVVKDAQKFATTPVEHDDELNPVTYDTKGSSDGQKGVGKPKDGDKPEGKPKGVKESARALAKRMLDEKHHVCARCGHTKEDHREDPEGTGVRLGACWNGSGNGNRCDCHKYVRDIDDIDESELQEMTGVSAIPAVESPMGQPLRNRFRKNKAKKHEQGKPSR
jgi:hypothetical protein